MMIARNHRGRSKRHRRGATVVEMGFVVSLMLMLMFGIIEYARLLFVLHMANNAARDTARYAASRTDGGGSVPGDPSGITTNDLLELARSGNVKGASFGPGMAGASGSLDNFRVEVFYADPAGLAMNPPVIRPHPASASTWDATGFGEKIAVRISGNYRPVLPSFLTMPDPVPLSVTTLISSEGN